MPRTEGTEPMGGDEMTIQFGNKTLELRIDKIVDTTKKDEAQEMYTILKETMVDTIE